MNSFAYCTLSAVALAFGAFFGIVMNSLYMHMRSGFADYRECNIPNVRKSAIVFGVLLAVVILIFGCITFGQVFYAHTRNLVASEWYFLHVLCLSELIGALIAGVYIRHPTELDPVPYEPAPKPLLIIRGRQLV